MKFAERLRQLREGANLSQEALAERSGVPVWTLRGIEQGHRLPSWQTVFRLTVGLGGSLGSWEGVEFEDEPPARKKAKPKKK